MQQKEAKTEESSKGLLARFASVKQSSVFRRVFVVVCLVHVLILSLPAVLTNFRIPVPYAWSAMLEVLWAQWPLPTFEISGEDGQQIIFSRFLCKLFEIMAQLMYMFDLLPKVFAWKERLAWRAVNLGVLFLIFAQIPLTLNISGEDTLGQSQRLRLVSITVSFLLVCEIISVRENRSRLLRSKHLPKGVHRASDAPRLNLRSQREKKVFTWAEIIKHDRREDLWVVINGDVYDLTAFLPRHPGGDMILDGAGGECTPMWYSYHSSASLKAGPPQKYRIGKVHDYHDFYSYSSASGEDFYLSLKAKVEAVMGRHQFQNSWVLFAKAALIMALFFYSQYQFTTQYTLFWCIIYSVVCSQVGVNVMHDGNHLAFSSNKTLSYAMGYMLDFTGSTSVVYRRSHNFGHHGCVNHYELDRAFDTTYPLIRLHPHQKVQPMHRYQHFYVWLLYGTVNFGDLIGTFDELQWMSNYPCRRGCLTWLQMGLQCLVKTWWLVANMVVPTYLHGFTSVYPIWMTYMFLFSYGYTLFFAVNHWTDIASTTDNDCISQTEWGVLQVVNSTNFSTEPHQVGDNLMTQACGGLNYQIEHHLFPYLPHTRYEAITPIVKEHCRRFGVAYNSYPSFLEALKGHYRYLRELSR